MWGKREGESADERGGDDTQETTESNTEGALTPSVVGGESDGRSRQLAALEQAQLALAEASSFEDIKDIRDKAEALRKYAASAELGLALQNKAAELKLRAERRAGELLRRLKLAGGDRTSTQPDQKLSLDELGINKHQSSRWQREAAVPEEAFEKLLQETTEGERELTSAALLRMARAFRQRKTDDASPEGPVSQPELALTDLASLVGQAEKFACIYATPPFSPPVKDSAEGAVDAAAAAARLEALCQLPVADVAAEHAHLHLWVGHEWLWSAPQLMEAWGFQSTSGLVWVQPQSAGGSYWRRAHEHLLLGIRGDLPFRTRGPLSWIRANRLRRGMKPERFRRIIQRVSPGPYLELFGTRPIKGWTVCRVELLE